MSLDPTTSQISLQKKHENIIKRDGLTDIDFFHDGETRTALSGVPHVAIYMDDKNFTQLLRLWYNIQNNDVSEREKIFLREKLQNHPAQLDFLKQIIYQLNFTMKRLKQKPNLSNRELVGLGTIAEYLKTFNAVLAEKAFKIKKYMETQKDGTTEINNALTNLPGLKAVQEIFK